jgi:hypothetical protein
MLQQRQHGYLTDRVQLTPESIRNVEEPDFRRMAETANEVERQRKLFVLADTWDEDARRLEETLARG